MMSILLEKSREIPNSDDLKRKCEEVETISIDNALFFYEGE